MSFIKRNGVLVFLILFVFTLFNRQNSSAAPDGSSLVYLPTIYSPTVDLLITNIIVTQGVQSDTNSVPLVKDRPTLVRIFAETDEPGGLDNISVRLIGTRNGSQFDSIDLGPTTVPDSATEGAYNSTFNTVLPSSWLNGTVKFTAVVDSDDNISELNESNNTMARTLSFNTVPDLSITVVPIDYSHQGSDSPGFYSGDRVDYISNFMMRTYPVANVDVRIRSSNYAYSGNLDTGNAWENLLDEVTILKQIDLGSVNVPEVYYGFIPIRDGSRRWFFSGIAGIGWIGGGFRTSLGLNLGDNDTTGSLAGHEVGHNFGRRHAPCNVSGDPNYPYGGASIGQFGYDNIESGSVSIKNPNSFVDFMSYCDPVWISDYTYEALLDDQQNNGRISNRADSFQESLLIRAVLIDDEQAYIKPIYTFNQVPTDDPEAADYFVELVKANGEVVARHPVAVAHAEELGVTLRAIFTAVPVPSEPFDTVRLVDAETVVGSRALTSSTAHRGMTATTVQSATSVTVRWGNPEIPAVVRYTADNGVNWVTVGVDRLGGEFVVDTTTLPGGDEGRFEVIFADTSQTAAISANLPAPLPNKAPIAWINGPSEIEQGEFHLLIGHGSDSEDGVLNSMQWFVNGELVSQETALSLHDLPVGEHQIELVVSDNEGQTATVQKVLTVR
ncbi:MAG: CARDB domain-containing protein [Chloroflexota bacterium]